MAVNVSVIIPCLNEENFIQNMLESLLANDYPKDNLEILIIDGYSVDNTKNLLEKYLVKNKNISLIMNQQKTFPSAINIGIENAKGDVIMVLGSHAIYPSDYIRTCTNYLYSYELQNVVNVGGVLETIAQKDGLIGLVISTVLSSKFGVGNSKFRIGSDNPLFVDTVFGGCYKSTVFEKYGRFNEALISSSDIEFNSRIIKNGEKILLIPELRVRYFTRSTLKSFLTNNLRNGFWAIYPIKYVNKIPVALRHFIPMVFTSTLLLSLLLSFLFPILLKIFIFICTIYIITNLIFTIQIKSKNLFIYTLLPLFFFLLHISYGVGSLLGLLSVIFSSEFYKVHLSK